MSKYTELWAAGLADLKTELETAMEKVFEIYIRTTPERLWEAITDPAIRAKYHFGAGVESDWTRRFALRRSVTLAPTALWPRARTSSCEPPRRLVQTMHVL